MFEGCITDVKGLWVGQVQDEEARTGVTVIGCDQGATGGVDVRGAAPGTRETDLLRPDCTVDVVHAVMLSGGSAFGLAAGDGVMKALAGRNIGVPVANIARVPIVCGAVLFDLGVGRADVWPDAAMGYRACELAGKEVAQGAVGAGCGASVGKLIPGGTPGRGGLGSASLRLPGGITVAALAAVNAAGDIYHPHTGTLLAAGSVNGRPAPCMELLLGGKSADFMAGGNTTLGVVATDARLTKAQANRLATCAHDGYAITIRPCHTPVDGDAIFALATGQAQGEPNLLILCAAAAEVMARAIANAVTAP